ncbi:MAG: arsenate reductase ArsC [Candidatus Thorarchaeota archaeon]
MQDKSQPIGLADNAKEIRGLKRVLFLCTGNSARSQMSEALLRLLGGDDYEVYSAGTHPGREVNPFVINVLKQRGADASRLHTKSIDRFEGEEFDLVVTVCDAAKRECPVFPGAKVMDHWSLEDPAAFEGTYEEILVKFRETRDDIEHRIKEYLLRGRLYNDPLGSLRL